MTLPVLIAEVQFTAGVWTDVSAYLQAPLVTARLPERVESPIIRYEAGHATIRLKNSDRRFDPTNLSGPYVSGGKTQVRAMRPVRIRATWSAVTYNVFRGYADEWNLEWFDPNYSVTTVPITDGFKVLAAKKRAAVSAVGAGEDTGARITRILDSAGWPSADRSIATGNYTLQATTLEGKALDELRLAADSEIGELYVDGQGRLVFRNRDALLTDTRSTTVQVTLGQTSPAPFLATLNTDEATLWNEVVVQRTGGAVQTVSDSASVTEFTAKTFERSDLILQTDSDVAKYAAWILYISKDPEERFDQIVINAHADPATLMPHVLGREIGDRIKIVRRNIPGGGSDITREAFIRGISHEVGQATWTTTWILQSATKYGSFLILDHSTLGLLNSGNAYSL